MADIHKDNMGPLLIITPDHMIGKKRFAAPRRTQNKFVPVGADSHFDRLITDVDMDRLSR
ncbi:hypothetical protein D3C86_1783040 [compost metagenome]